MIRKQDRRVWYAEFSACVRRYIGEVVRGDSSAFLSMTVTEIIDAIELSPMRDPVRHAGCGELRDLLERLDVIRFSGRDGGDSRAEDLAAFREIVSSFEKAAADSARQGGTSSDA
jgi:hypothetical protein